MKVSEMIELLQQMPQDLEVYSCCDHGQTPEESCTPSVKVALKEEYDRGRIEDYMEYDDAIESGYVEDDLVKIVLL